eukprot:scaffold32398_cov53-Attheya_sp.AAC.2
MAFDTVDHEVLLKQDSRMICSATTDHQQDTAKNWNVETLQYKGFPKSKQSGNKRGKLLGQKEVGTAFDLFYLFYVDDGAMLFTLREDLETWMRTLC